MHLRFFFYLLILLLSVIASAVSFKKLTAPFKIFGAFLFVTFISEVFSKVLAFKIHNNSPVYHFYVLLLVLFLSIFYFLQIPQKAVRTFIVITCFSFLILSSLNSIFLQPLYSFPSLSIMVASVIIILYSLTLFIYLLDKKMVFNRQSIMWLNTSILIYFTIQLFNWGFYSYLIRNNLNSKIINDVAYFTNILFYSSIALLLFTYSKNKNVNAAV